MSEFGGPETFSPGEGEGGVSEQLSEEARQRFAAAGAALQQIYREEKRAKRRDQGVAQAILRFLTDDQRTHLSLLIARLCSQNCPSPFLLAILSLINDDCRTATEEYLRDNNRTEEEAGVSTKTALMQHTHLDKETNAKLIEWITRLQLVLSIETTAIMRSLRTEEALIDPTILQLTTFVFQDFLGQRGKQTNFERLQNLAAGILQMTFAPFIEKETIEKKDDGNE